MKKYELTSETIVRCGQTLHRIRALVSFSNVAAGEIGGFIEKEENLDHSGNAWVSGDAWVSDYALVSGNARVSGNAMVTENAWVSGNAQVSGNAVVTENAEVKGSAVVTENAMVAENAVVKGSAVVSGNAWVTGSAVVAENAMVERSNHLLTIGALGSRDDFTTFMRSKDKKIIVACGCFRGTIDEFAEKVKETHGDSKHAKTYMAAIELAKLQIDDVEGG